MLGNVGQSGAIQGDGGDVGRRRPMQGNINVSWVKEFLVEVSKIS